VSVAPVHIRWQNAQRREHLLSYAASKFGFQGCIGATDGTPFPLWRWGSLKELRVGLASDAHLSFAMNWIVACCLLHNISVARGNDLPRQPLADPSPSSIDDHGLSDQRFRATIRYNLWLSESTPDLFFDTGSIPY